MNSNRDKVNAIVLIALLWLPACASSAPKVPYPVFVQVDKLDDVFLAGLPGVRARQFRGDARSIRVSTLLRIPADWEFSTGAAPDKSVEIFVLAGELDVGGLTLHPGGYAYLPPGSMGSSMRTKGGAEILYFLDDVDAHAVIQMPLITGVDSGRWEPMSDDPEDFGLLIFLI